MGGAPTGPGAGAPDPVEVCVVATPLLGRGRAGRGRHSQLLLDAGHHTGRRVEEVLAHLGPASEILDREQLGGRREARAADALYHRTVAVLREDLLRRRAVQ